MIDSLIKRIDYLIPSITQEAIDKETTRLQQMGVAVGNNDRSRTYLITRCLNAERQVQVNALAVELLTLTKRAE